MSKAIDGILDDLVQEKAQILGQIRAMDLTLSNMRDELQRVEKTIATLKGESPNGSANGSSKPKPSLDEIRNVVTHVLSKGPSDEPKIRDELFRALDERNRKKNGVHNTLRKLLRDEYRFDGIHWRLKANGV